MGADSLRRTARFVATRLNNGLAICAVMQSEEVAESVFGLAVAPRRAAGGSRSTVVAIEITCFASVIY